MESDKHWWRRTYDPEKPGAYMVRRERVNPDGGITATTAIGHWSGEIWDVPNVQCWRPIQDDHADDPGPVGPRASKDGTPGPDYPEPGKPNPLAGPPGPPDEAVKHDTDKLRMDLIPPEAVTALAEVLAYGAKKYGDRNWEKGIRYSRVFAAVQRHLWAWWRGEDVDEESKLGHLQHALCGLAFLVTYKELGMIHMDDRE